MEKIMFLDTADDRYTDRALMEAILQAAGDDESRAERVWEAPTDAELVAIVEIVTQNGRYKTTDFCWGAAGSDWAKL